MKTSPAIPKIKAGDTISTVRRVRSGFPFKVLSDFQKASQFTWVEMASLVSIQKRTLIRRQKEGKLQADESDRVWRAVSLFDKTVALFEGDKTAARTWLQAPQTALGGMTPLEFATTNVGAREVENLIGRLEHGVFV